MIGPRGHKADWDLQRLPSFKAPGVEISIDRNVRRIEAGKEVVISLGAIDTPKLLMQPSIGDQEHLKAHGANVEALPPRNNAGEAAFSGKAIHRLMALICSRSNSKLPIQVLRPQVKLLPPVPGL
jgi:hypothetical protein